MMIRLLDPSESFVMPEAVVAKSTVRMKLYPYTKHEKIDRGAARHLYRLLQQYNWSLEDPSRYQERWAAFWPSISAVERKALALFVMTNSGGNFGTRLVVTNLPVDLEVFEGLNERVVMHPRVGSELRRVVGQFYARLTYEDEIEAHLCRDCPREYAAIEQHGGASLAFVHGLLLPSEFESRCVAALVAEGRDEDNAKAIADCLHESLEHLLIAKESRLWP